MKVAVADIETTNFLGRKGKIIEIGIASLDTDSGAITEAFHSLCFEDGIVAADADAWIFKNSDLTFEEVAEAPDLKDLREKIESILAEHDVATAFNKKFDFDFLRDRGFVLGPEWPCPMLASVNICKVAKKGKQAHHKGYKWPTVEEAWAFFFPDKPYVEEHRGLDDAMHEAAIVYELFKLGVMTSQEKK